MNVPITKAVFDEGEASAVAEVLRSGWVVQGPRVATFEKEFAAFAGAQHAIATTSCTTALHLALIALGIGPGDEVLVPAFTWIATANVVEYVGATPVFCDVDLATFNIDVAELRRKRTSRTKAIIPVHLFGLAAEMQAIMSFAKQHSLGVVEDAACGFGAYYEGRHVGTFGDAGCFSFHPRKAITTGEGGMISTSDARINELCRSLRDHGASKSDLTRHHNKGSFQLPEFNVLGFNYRMTDIQGAIGVEQMKKAPAIQAGRTQRAARYTEYLQKLSWLRTPFTPTNCVHGFQSYVCLFAPETPTLSNYQALHERRNVLMQNMETAGVATRQGTHAVTTLNYYVRKYNLRIEDFPGALFADRLSISLPVFAAMSDEEQDFVVQQLLRADV